MADVGEEVEVGLMALSGDELGTLHAAPHAKLSRVKRMIREEFGYPVESQQLLLRDAVLDDDGLVDALPRPCLLSLVLWPFDKSEALYSAAESGHEAAVRSLLLRAACDHEERCNMLLTRVLFLVEDDDWEDAWLERSEGGTALHVAAHGGHERVLRALLESAHDPEVREQILVQYDAERSTGLHLAASEGHGNAIRALLESAPSAEVQERMLMLRGGQSGDAIALHQAARRGHETAVRALLLLAPNTQVREQMLVHNGSRGGWTALHHAASNNKEMATRALLESAPSPGMSGCYWPET